ncbi:hypothetical protein ACGLQ7_004542 [Escherichia albertii]|uniref:hypothetical protein n=1 Tax=Escherichia albertii TaxID=208962 RepID=UPI002119CBCF|nr:hypothetical protein [Escherichia albertii]MCQ8936655.1 hypothetical protein [Escherichia albertii]UUL06190.1 hypothetical protein NIZ17_03270 [Escherichia albertii]
MSSKRSSLRGRLQEIKTTDSEVIMDISCIEQLLIEKTKEMLDVLDIKISELKDTPATQLILERSRNKFLELSPDVQNIASKLLATLIERNALLSMSSDERKKLANEDAATIRQAFEILFS